MAIVYSIHNFMESLHFVEVEVEVKMFRQQDGSHCRKLVFALQLQH